MDLLSLLGRGAQVGKTAWGAVKKPLGLYHDVVSSRGFLLGDALSAWQPNYLESVRTQADMQPKYRPSADAEESYYDISQMAKQRADLMNAVAKIVRSKGGGQADIERNWSRMRNQGRVLNPADYLRGAGRDTPKQGNVRMSTRNYTMQQMPMTKEQQFHKWLQSQGLEAMPED
jgi:hypothetical protein